jgi:hypothetical protein
MSRISGAATETVIRTGLIGQKATQSMLAVTSNLGTPSGLSASTPEEIKQIKSAEMPHALEYLLNKPMTSWERYRLFFLNGNINVFSLPEASLAEWRKKSRFYQVSVVNEIPDKSEDLRNAIFEVFREKNDKGEENKEAPEWDTGEKIRGKYHSYELGINSQSDILMIDVHDPKENWKRLEMSGVLDDPRFKSKLVVIRKHNGEWDGEMEKNVLSKLLNNNKGVLYIVDADEKRGTGPYMQIIMNHNWADAMQIDHGLSRLGKRFFGGNRNADNKEVEKILHQANVRFNFREHDAKGAVRSLVVNEELLNNINNLYEKYATEIKKCVDKHNEKYPNNSTKVVLTNATFLQLFLLDIAGGRGSVLRFRNDKKLDHHTVGSGDSLKKLDNAIREGYVAGIERVLNIYDRKKSTMAKIGEADEKLANPRAKYEMALATWKSEGAEWISGDSMVSIMKEDEDSEYSKTIGCPAAPPFMKRVVFTANMRLGPEDSRGLKKMTRLIINYKANLQ